MEHAIYYFYVVLSMQNTIILLLDNQLCAHTSYVRYVHMVSPLHVSAVDGHHQGENA